MVVYVDPSVRLVRFIERWLDLVKGAGPDFRPGDCLLEEGWEKEFVKEAREALGIKADGSEDPVFGFSAGEEGSGAEPGRCSPDA